MFILHLRLHPSNEISICLNDLLQAGPDTGAGPLNLLPGDFGKHLLDGGDEGLLGIMRGPIGVPLLNAQYKNVQGIDVWGARGPKQPVVVC